MIPDLEMTLGEVIVAAREGRLAVVSHDGLSYRVKLKRRPLP